MVSVLFVCLGNICRSPLAEGIFVQMAADAGLSEILKIDSAGTGSWHEGELPDRRSIQIAENNGLKLTHRARQLRPKDYFDFHYILTMDETVHAHVTRAHQARPNAISIIERMRAYDPLAGAILEVPDPYSGSLADFEETYRILHRACGAFMQNIREKHSL